MSENFFSKSLKLLMVAVLILLAFFQDPKYQWMYIAVFGFWAACLLLRILAGRILWLGQLLKKAAQGIAAMRKAAKAKPRKEPKGTPLAVQADITADKLLLSHLSCRVTDKLKAVFPDAAWQWQEERPELIARGGTGRIRVEGAGEYTHADVTVDSYFRLSFAMMKIVNLLEAAYLPETSETDAAEAPEPVQASAADWFEWVGKEILLEVITELNTRGYSRVFIKETGEVYVVEEGNETVKATLKEMPGKSKWEEIVSVLAANELKGIIDNDRLAVSWA